MIKKQNFVTLKNLTSGQSIKVTNSATFAGALRSARGGTAARARSIRCGLYEFQGPVGGADFMGGEPPGHYAGAVASSDSPENYSWALEEEGGVIFLKEVREWVIHVTTNGEINLVMFHSSSGTGRKVSFFAEVDPSFSISNGDTVGVTHTCFSDLTGSTDLVYPRTLDLPAYFKAQESSLEMVFSDIDGVESHRQTVSSSLWVPRVLRSSADWPPGTLDGWRIFYTSSNDDAITLDSSLRRSIYLESPSGAFVRAGGVRDGVTFNTLQEDYYRINALKGFGVEGDISPEGINSPLLCLGREVAVGLRIPAGESPFSFRGVMFFTGPNGGPSSLGNLSRGDFESGVLGDFENASRPGTDWSMPYFYLALDEDIVVPADNSLFLRVKAVLAADFPEGADSVFPGVSSHPLTPGPGFKRAPLPGLNGEPHGRDFWEKEPVVFGNFEVTESMYSVRKTRGPGDSEYTHPLPTGSGGNEFHFSTKFYLTSSSTSTSLSLGVDLEFLDGSDQVAETFPVIYLNGPQAEGNSRFTRVIAGEIPPSAEKVRVSLRYSGSSSSSVYFHLLDSELWIEDD